MSPWLQSEEIDGEDGLSGDRAGFKLLRDRIDQLLLHDGPHSIRLEGEGVNLHTLMLQSPPEAPPPATPRQKILDILTAIPFFAILLAIPLIFILGLIHLIQLLS